MFPRRFTCLLSLAFLCLVQAGAARAARPDYGLRFEARQVDGHLDFIAHNQGPATLTAYAKIGLDNMRSDLPSYVPVVVGPHQSKKIGSAYRVDRSRPANASVSSMVTWGDLHAVHASDARYRLPYENGGTYPISQAFGAPLTTHAQGGTEHAVDFAVPEGTPIIAARDGLIVEVTLTHSRGGPDPALKDEANVVQILHDDGTVASYAHLGSRAAPVKAGDRVRAGTLIGYSGDTGYSSGPHLHFAVSRPQIGPDGRLRDAALPVVFYAGVPAVEFVAQKGLEVTAVYASDATPGSPVAPSTTTLVVDVTPRAQPDAARDMSPLYMGIAFLFTMFGVLGVRSSIGASRASSSE